MTSYWFDDDIAVIEEAQSFKELLPVALAIISRMPKPVGQICGPISSGGKGSIEQNLAAINEVISTLTAQGKSIFDQVPFEGPMQRIKGLNNHSNNLRLLEDFYLPLFTFGSIQILYFLPDWQSSHGARWEHEQALRLGISIVYLD